MPYDYAPLPNGIMVATFYLRRGRREPQRAIRWIRAEDLPKEDCLREFYKKFAIVTNGNDGRPKRYGCPRNFQRLTMSWYLNDPKAGEVPNVTCDENYEFWSARNIRCGEELTVDSTTYSDHAKAKSVASLSPRKKSPRGK
jgi:hypothetical protein